MLTELLKSYRPQLEALASAWLADGAESFSVWSENRVLATWQNGQPADSTPDAAITAPMKAGGRVLGELRVSGRCQPDDQSRLQAEAGLLTALAPLARDLFHVTSELVNTRDQVLAIYQLSEVSRSSLEVEQNLRNLAALLPKLGKAESAFVLLRVESGQQYVVQYPEPVFEDSALLDICSQIGSADHLILTHTSSQASWPPQVRNLLALPLQVRSASLAAIGVINKNSDRGSSRFLTPEIKLVHAIAGYAGPRLENALMYQENLRMARLQTELELAQRVQLSLMPKDPPVISGVDLSAASYPASLVGGDFYDFIIRPGLPITLAIGDLSGKGFPAALLMSMTRSVLRSELVLRTENNQFSTPQRILQSLNNELFDDFTRLSSFATLFVGQYDPLRRELCYANAGHSPVIYCPAGRPPQLLQADGVPLGILPDCFSRNMTLLLLPGDVLLIGSDGLSEASNPAGERFGYQRLVDLAGSLAHLPASIISQKIYQAVASFRAGQPQDDDQTLVVIKSTKMALS